MQFYTTLHTTVDRGTSNARATVMYITSGAETYADKWYVSVDTAQLYQSDAGIGAVLKSWIATPGGPGLAPVPSVRLISCDAEYPSGETPTTPTPTPGTASCVTLTGAGVTLLNQVGVITHVASVNDSSLLLCYQTLTLHAFLSSPSS
jgi:hypothetical protein